MRVVQLMNRAADINKFIKLEYKLYKDDKNWVSHLHIDTKAMLLGKKKPSV